MSPTVYLVTGAARGIGYSLIEELITRPNTLIFAGVRVLPLPSDSKLAQLASQHPESVIPIKVTASDEADNAAAAEVIKARAGKVDAIIANAGTSSGNNPLLELTAVQLRSDLETNTVGPAVLFRAFGPLLLAAGTAKFVVVSSVLGQITDSLPYSFNAYGASKAAANYLVKKIDQEFPTIIAFPIHPGVVDTDMGRTGAALFGVTPKDMGAISPAQSAAGIIAVVEKATKDTHGGKFWDEKGVQLTY